MYKATAMSPPMTTPTRPTIARPGGRKVRTPGTQFVTDKVPRCLVLPTTRIILSQSLLQLFARQIMTNSADKQILEMSWIQANRALSCKLHACKHANPGKRTLICR
jgi:hypothetical protein